MIKYFFMASSNLLFIYRNRFIRISRNVLGGKENCQEKDARGMQWQGSHIRSRGFVKHFLPAAGPVPGSLFSATLVPL
jgi:hypothetical protein